MVACGGEDPPVMTDGGVTPGTDGGPPMTTLPPPMAIMGGGAPNLACMGTRTAPAPGAAATINAHTYFFPNTMEDVPTATIHVFPGNTIAADCTGDCITAMSDASGAATFMLPQDSWFAYRVLASTGGAGNQPVLTLGYNRAAATGTVQLPVVGTTILGLLPSLFVRQRVMGTAAMSGSITDCDGAPIQNVQVRIYRDGTALVPTPRTERMGFFVGYLMGTTPAGDHTTADGTFVSANIMPGAGRVEVYGRMAETDTELMRIGCEEGDMAADGVTILTVGPTRADYASGSGCL